MGIKKDEGFFAMFEYAINIDDRTIRARCIENRTLEISFSTDDRNFDVFLNPDGTWTWKSFKI